MKIIHPKLIQILIFKCLYPTLNQEQYKVYNKVNPLLLHQTENHCLSLATRIRILFKSKTILYNLRNKCRSKNTKKSFLIKKIPKDKLYQKFKYIHVNKITRIPKASPHAIYHHFLYPKYSKKYPVLACDTANSRIMKRVTLTNRDKRKLGNS